jgi:hypothetical protein
MKLIIPAALALSLGIAACTPKEIERSCTISKLDYEYAAKHGRGGEAEREARERLRSWCASYGHVYP